MGEPRLINTDDLPPVPWKNGGGVTREIAQDIGPDGIIWRLSMADVETEGAFSIFPGLSRILTVIEGDGLELCSADQEREVPYCRPFAFSGDTPIRSVLRGGRIRDFNVIFDNTVIDAEVSILDGPTQIDLRPGADLTYAIFGVVGDYSCNNVGAKKGTAVLINDGSASVELPLASKLLVVRLKNRISL